MTSRVATALRRAGHSDVEAELWADITSAESFDDALSRLTHWVTVS